MFFRRWRLDSIDAELSSFKLVFFLARCSQSRINSDFPESGSCRCIIPRPFPAVISPMSLPLPSHESFVMIASASASNIAILGSLKVFFVVREIRLLSPSYIRHSFRCLRPRPAPSSSSVPYFTLVILSRFPKAFLKVVVLVEVPIPDCGGLTSELSCPFLFGLFFCAGP